MKLAYDDAGSGNCVVLIHGHPFDRTLWQPQVARVDAMMSAAPAAGAAAALRGRAERPDYRTLLAGQDIPALVCAGSAGPWSDREVTAEIVAHLKRPEQVMIDGVGHLPNLEAQDVFNDVLRAFLQAHAPG